ncbi:MAG: T9SS type A sorting domain-containing protein [Crocinitomicaceae bacterium]|nr:T9SS type A sorting domain-containing protein [Crocinitomicaceae bacterium]
MKNLLLAFTVIAGTAFGQVKTTTQNGDFWNPFVWDCTCVPANGDSLVINHAISLSSGIAYTQGQILINSSGSLDDGTNTFSFYINGGSLINNGTLIIDNLLLDTLGWIENNGTATLDSVWTRSTTTNTGTISTNAFAHDEYASFTNSGTLDVTNNFANQGDFMNSGVMTVGNNASNCNIQNSNAVFDNDGFFCVAGDYINCGTDTLRGDGTIYIGGTSTNGGEVEGNLLIHTPSGAFNFNTGNIGPNVSFGTDACSAGVEEEEYEEEEIDWTIYPNPASTIIRSSEINVTYKIYDLSGREVMHGVSFNGEIHIDQLTNGTYTIQLINTLEQTTSKTFIKL